MASARGVLFGLDATGLAPPGASAGAPRRIVYTAGRKTAQSFSWFQNGLDVAIGSGPDEFCVKGGHALSIALGEQLLERRPHRHQQRAPLCFLRRGDQEVNDRAG